MDVIGQLLRASLLADLGQDEDRATKLRAAADDLAGRLMAGDRDLMPYAVTAGLDEAGSADSTVLKLADGYLLDSWETLRNVFPQTPIEVLRAIVMEAVARAAEREPACLQAVWYAARTAVDELSVGRWAKVAGTLLQTWTAAVEPLIAGWWTPRPEAISLRMPSVPDTGQVAVTDNLVTSAQQVVAASGGNWQTFAQQWMGQLEGFAKDVSAAVAGGTHAAADKATAQLRDFAKDLGGKLRDALAAHDKVWETMQLRTDLLWWKNSAFSDRLGRRYRDLPSSAHIAVAAALDLHSLVPVIAPVSVEHVLADLVVEADQQSSELTAAELRAARDPALPDRRSGVTPGLLLDVLAGDSAGSPMLGEDRKRPAQEVAVLLFRELQVTRLVRPSSAPE